MRSRASHAFPTGWLKMEQVLPSCLKEMCEQSDVYEKVPKDCGACYVKPLGWMNKLPTTHVPGRLRRDSCAAPTNARVRNGSAACVTGGYRS